MPKSRVRGGGFKLATRGEGFSVGQGYSKEVTLLCCLVPETNATHMTIKWYRESECIFLYKKGRTIQGRGYEGRLHLNIPDLRKGYLSLTLQEYQRSDDGVYICGVQHGNTEQEIAVGLMCYPTGYANNGRGCLRVENGMLRPIARPGNEMAHRMTAPPGFTAVHTKTLFTGVKVVRLSASPSQLPQLTLCVSGKMVRFLVDTGATISCIRQKDLKCTLSNNSVQHASISGVPKVEPLSLPLVIDLDGITIEHSFIVSNTIQMSVLGRDLLNSFNATV